MDPDWVRQIRDRCIDQEVPFFFKQWGGVQKKRFGRELDGRTWDEMPSAKRRWWPRPADSRVSTGSTESTLWST
jgi:hypothetical protein